MDDICDFFSLVTISSYPIDVIKTSIFTETLVPIRQPPLAPSSSSTMQRSDSDPVLSFVFISVSVQTAGLFLFVFRYEAMPWRKLQRDLSAIDRVYLAASRIIEESERRKGSKELGLVKIKKREYYKNIDRNKGNPAAMWKILKGIIRGQPSDKF